MILLKKTLARKHETFYIINDDNNFDPYLNMNVQYQKNILRLFLIVTFTLVCGGEMNAQVTDTIHNKIEDGWIEKMGDKIALDVSFNNLYETFEVKNPDNKFTLYPNAPTNLKLTVNYRFISFGFQFAPDFLPGNGDEDLKGKTKSFGIGTSLIFKHWLFDIKYSKIRGYYFENSDDFIMQLEGEPYIQFPDLNYKGINFSSAYSTNSKFSMRSLTSQTERQLKSAGSFLPSFNFRYYNIDDKSTAAAATQKSNNIEASIGPGYVYTFVAKEKFYLSLGGLASFGYLNTKLTTRLPNENAVSNQDNFIFRWDGKTGIGFNGSRFYTGLYANISGTKYKQENTTAVNTETRVSYHLFLGIRIESPDYLNRFMNKMESKLIK